jgi:ADP-ribosylglycohydrolase
MRVAPLGAFYADRADLVESEARLTAMLTHQHPEGIAGAIAVAYAAQWCALQGEKGQRHMSQDRESVFIPYVANRTPSGLVREGIETARCHLCEGSLGPMAAALALGNGAPVLAHTTVPFALWCAWHGMGDFKRALLCAGSVGGDSDTICAIVGGVLAPLVGLDGIPQEWLANTEPLDLDVPGGVLNLGKSRPRGEDMTSVNNLLKQIRDQSRPQ